MEKKNEVIYSYCKSVRDIANVRDSFNRLTRETFGFDFVNWFELGYWGQDYVPHVILADGQVVSNVSVNFMQFDRLGERKNYIQLGTVMTDRKYREQGLNRRIMEDVLREYQEKVDGIYLFGNDQVLNYYPKFGFRPSKEYEYYLPCKGKDVKEPFVVEKVVMTQKEQREKVYDWIRNCADSNCRNGNDGMYMNKNIGLYQFWLLEYMDSVYYIPENHTYFVAKREGKCLYLEQVFGEVQIEVERLVSFFKGERGMGIEEIVLGYTPINKKEFLVRKRRIVHCLF